MKNTINKIILFAAVVFSAGLSNISANAAGAISGGFSADGTNFIIGVAVGYAENGTDPLTAVNRGANVDANNACLNHPDSDNCGIITDFANQYFAVYADLSDIANIETWTETDMNAADAQAAAMAMCADSTKCDCLAIARDITENAIPMTVAFSFTATDAGSTTTCDTVIEPDVCADGDVLQPDGISCGPPPPNCDGGSTFGVDADGDGNCDCLEDAQIQVDAENCRSPETLQDCVNAGFTSFNPETVMCTNTAPNCTDNATLNDAGVCECDPGFPILEEEGENTFACRAPLVATDCGDDLPDFYDGSTCVSDCGEGFRNPANAGETCIEITAADCGQNNMPNFYDGSMCVADCGDDFVNPANAGETCRPIAEVLATVSVSPTYTAESCERAGWISSITINSEKTEVAEVCGIPVMRDDSATVTVAAAAAEFAPLQFDNLSMATGCIIRESSNFLTLPDCNDSQLFGNDGFPQMPADFNIANDRLIIVVVADGRNRIFFNDNEIRIAVASPRNNDAEVAIIGAVGVAMAMYAIADFLHDGRPADAFAFSPEFGYRISENDYFVQAGGKIEYAVNENLRMQWSAGQTNTGGDFGDFRYLSKAEYKADFWTAAFSESVAGKTADYDFSLSADLQNGIWKISPVYRMQSEWKESDSGIETETQNELNLESVLRYNRWTITPSAGFRWQNANNFAENGKLQMNAVYRF